MSGMRTRSSLRGRSLLREDCGLSRDAISCPEVLGNGLFLGRPSVKVTVMSDAEDDVLKLRWRANQTPRAILDDVVEQATGAPPRSVERLLVSYSNDVYDVVAADGRSLIVRVHARSDPGHFDVEVEG